MVTDQSAREADQDRRQGRQPWPLRHLPNGGDVLTAATGEPRKARRMLARARRSRRATGAAGFYVRGDAIDTWRSHLHPANGFGEIGRLCCSGFRW